VPSPPEPHLTAAAHRQPAPSVEEVWQLLGRADVVVRAMLEAPDRAARQRGEQWARAWLRDLGQAWVHTPCRR
jgi:hypothetical protein